MNGENKKTPTGPSDLRSPIARARDLWLASGEGRKLCDPAILRDPSHKQYLQNRIELAFLAGVAAAQKLELENTARKQP